MGRQLQLDLATITVLTLFALIVFQAIGIVFGNVLGLNLNLGPIFILLPVVFAGAFSVVVFKKLLTGYQVTKQDMFAMIITTVLAVLVLFFLRDLVPEIFRQSIISLQSIIGL